MESRSERRERERREREREYREQERRERERDSKEAERRERRIREIERELELEEERKRARRPRKKKKIAGRIVGIAIAVFVGLMIFQAWRATQIDMVQPIVKAAAGDFMDAPRINILFLGNSGGLSDTFMVFSYNVETNTMDQISIPRDTFFDRPGYSGASLKINSIYSSEGYKAAATAASKVLGGIPIHYYVMLEPDGAARIIDAMGGVYVDVPFRMEYTDAAQGLFIDLQPGKQLLNGDQTLQFLRYRSGYPNGDLGRIEAQQGFLKSLLKQGGGLDYVRLGWTAFYLSKTNISMPAAFGLVLRATGMTTGAFNTHTIPGTTGMKDGLSFFFHDEVGTRGLMRAIYAT